VAASDGEALGRNKAFASGGHCGGYNYHEDELAIDGERRRVSEEEEESRLGHGPVRPIWSTRVGPAETDGELVHASRSGDQQQQRSMGRVGLPR
jgi:hypothetical protein